MTIIFARQQWAVHCVIVCWDGRDNAATVTIVQCPLHLLLTRHNCCNTGPAFTNIVNV